MSNTLSSTESLDLIRQQLSTSPTASHWEQIGIKPHHGINVPLFSLHSQESCGIGEYLDLLPLIKWCEEIGFDVIQLLPLNDTGNDASPYCAISANALNPLHLSLSQLPHVSEYPSLKEKIDLLRKLNTLQRIDYEAVRQQKELFLREYFRLCATSMLTTPEFQIFKNSHSWLLGYALFKTFKIKRQWQSWQEWPAPWRDPQFLEPNDIPEDLYEEVELHLFIQFLCFQQLEEVKRFASFHHVFIKGDIPILINKESADVWLNRKIFLLDFDAGAPPDMYSKEGQKWGFPLYNWKALENEFYQWWIERLKVAAHFYHIYRIDHIVGFYRIWGVKEGQKPKEGVFVPEDPALWIGQGNEHLRMMLNHCLLLPIGEDLGTIPPEVRIHLKTLGICGTKVMRWERRWLTDKSFIDPKDYDPLSMTTISTHDSETLEQWWSLQKEEARLYSASLGAPYESQISKEMRIKILKISHRSASLFHINLLQEYLALIPGMTWPNPQDERINIPGTVSTFNWSYRFKPLIETIINSQLLKSAILDIRPLA